MDVLILIACTGRAFRGFCGIRSVFSTTQTHLGTRDDSFLKSKVTMTIPQHPTLEWPPIEIEVVGYRFVDTFEIAALKAITSFCEHHPDEVAAYPIGLFPAVSAGNAEWLYRTTHFGHLIGDVAEETI